MKKLKSALAKYSRINPYCLFIAIVSVYCILDWVNNEYVLTRGLYQSALIERLSVQRINDVFDESRKYRYISYFFIPASLLIKVTFTASCLYIGLYFKDIKFSFRKLINLAVKAEIIFVCAHSIRLFVLLSRIEPTKLEDLNYFPLSLIDITGTSGIYPWLVYVLQTLNVFELTYWLMLAAGLNILTGRNFNEFLLMVLETYVIGLSLWILTVTFFLASVL